MRQRIHSIIFQCLALGIICLLSACSSTKIEEYANETPALNLAEYFNGKTHAYGIFTW